MTKRQKLTLAQVLADHRAVKLREEFTTEWAISVLYRPPALVLAWALQGTPVGPTMITLAGLLTLPMMVLAAALLPANTAILYLIALAAVFMILDCADGTLARITGRSTSLGQYADFASDVCYRIVFYGAAGWVLTRHPALAGHWLSVAGFPLALFSAWMMTFARLCRVYAELRFPRISAEPPRKTSAFGAVAGFISGLDGLVPLVAAGAWQFAAPQSFFLWVFCYAALDVANTQFSIITDLRKRQ